MLLKKNQQTLQNLTSTATYPIFENKFLNGKYSQILISFSDYNEKNENFITSFIQQLKRIAVQFVLDACFNLFRWLFDILFLRLLCKTCKLMVEERRTICWSEYPSLFFLSLSFSPSLHFSVSFKVLEHCNCHEECAACVEGKGEEIDIACMWNTAMLMSWWEIWEMFPVSLPNHGQIVLDTAEGTVICVLQFLFRTTERSGSNRTKRYS